MEWLSDPTLWVGLLTLIFLEIVLGIDNLVFIAILSDKLPPGQRDRARVIGLSLALLMRLALLASISWVMSLTAPLFSAWRFEVSWRDLILILGGLFLLIKATTEIHDRLEAQDEGRPAASRTAAFWPIVAQIVVLDAVFSLDSVITAVGMVDELYVMMAAVVIAVAAMLLASKPLTAFIAARPSLIILCLGFLLMIGLVLVVDGLGLHIPKGYVYAAIGFSVLIEALNQVAASKRREYATLQPSRQRIANAVLRILGAVPLQTFAPVERRMVRSVLGLSERRITAIMTPRPEVVWLDLAAPAEEILAAVRASPHREFPVGRGSIDELAGIARKEDLLSLCVDRQPVDPGKVLREPLFIPASASVLDALNFFKRTPAELAVVVDEYGGFEGVVTRTDLLEAIAGDLPGQSGAEPQVGELPGGALSIDGALPLPDLQERLRIESLPEGEYHTAAGLVLALLGRIPAKGEKVEWDGWTLEVSEMQDHRLARLIARRATATGGSV